MQNKGVLLLGGLLLALPAVAFAQAPQALEINGKAVVAGESVPVRALISSDAEVVLSNSKKEGSVPVTITVYIAPKPKPKEAEPASSTLTAAVQSSQGIQESIANFSPQTAKITEPFFSAVDSGRESANNIVQEQLRKTKSNLGTDAGKVLGAEATKNAAQNPGGTFWYILQTLYLYLLTLLGFVIGSAGAFYPLFAVVVLYLLWRLFKKFRSPAY